MIITNPLVPLMHDPVASDPPGLPEDRNVPLTGEPLLEVRFAVPAAPKAFVRRPALAARVTEGVRGPLTLVSGAAGAGKTALMGDWARSGSVPRAIAWVTAEPRDTPELFWAHALEALRRTGVRLRPEVPAPARGHGVDGSFLTRVAAALAARAEPTVLVVDQFDGLAAGGIADGLHFVLAHANGRLRLVLTSRTDPLMPLHRYRASGDITEIRNADLVFTAAEAGELLRVHGLDVSPACVELLVQRTGGWAAGVRLCALAMQRSHDPEAFVREFDADRTAVADYLIAEVLNAQPPATQDLLLRSCVTDRVLPDLADALTGRQDAGWTLARLAGANAFLERIDGAGCSGGAWYRFHPLFAEVLRAHLRYQHPGLEPRLRGRAARWLAEAGHVDDAVAQAAAAGDWLFAAASVIDDLAIARVADGWQTSAFARMPADLPDAACALVTAACRLAAGDIDGCAAGLRRADAGLTDSADPRLLLGRAVLGMLVGRRTGDPAVGDQAARAEDLLRRVPQRLREQHVTAVVSVGLGAAELAAGHLDPAEAGLQAAVAACGCPYAEAPLCDALGCLALVELLRGRLREAEARASEALAKARRSAVRGPPTGLGHVVLAAVAAERDDLETARAELGTAHASARPPVEPLVAVQAAVVGARLATAAGDWEEALALLHGAELSLRTAFLSDWEVDELAIAKSVAHLAQGDADAALAVLGPAPAGRPEHTVAEARALLAVGSGERALALLAGLGDDRSSTAACLAEARLLQAEAAAASGSPCEAERRLRQALELARPERLRRVFVEHGGPWLRQFLRQDPQLARAHAWLPERAVGSPPLGARERTPTPITPLSDRERDVLVQAAQLSSNEEIAAALYVSANTVKTHLTSIYRKLGVSRRRDAVRKARDLGIL
ncbi:LuxR C-terminal-related transcriptional regulator [Yinghuangia seranimata]|uniref:LuxR C-terminal-related transcriptional regulator n=1 Tax=Yinghuangia seranimata TaxID=408067 RepID=UPI00248D03D7|nr:LuxR C-terminal-related transcriptional regulator [Yinghuangia seranimata]MDI2124993.1 LuxR C-terminal-related transcriptional regulator [Yinghuangia seranimata]